VRRDRKITKQTQPGKAQRFQRGAAACAMRSSREDRLHVAIGPPCAKRTQPENRNDLNENWRATADEDGHYAFAVAL
jgi:hypothetical protein